MPWGVGPCVTTDWGAGDLHEEPWSRSFLTGHSVPTSSLRLIVAGHEIGAVLFRKIVIN